MQLNFKNSKFKKKTDLENPPKNYKIKGKIKTWAQRRTENFTCGEQCVGVFLWGNYSSCWSTCV